MTAPRMTAREPVERQNQPLHGAILAKGLHRVFGAGRVVPARARHMGRYQQLIATHDSHKKTSGNPAQNVKQSAHEQEKPCWLV